MHTNTYGEAFKKKIVYVKSKTADRESSLTQKQPHCIQYQFIKIK